MTNEVQVFNGLKIKEVNGQVMFEAECSYARFTDRFFSAL